MRSRFTIHRLRVAGTPAYGLFAPLPKCQIVKKHLESPVPLRCFSYKESTIGHSLSSGPFFQAANVFRIV